ALPKRLLSLPRTLVRTIAAALALVVFGFGAWIAVVDDPLGGEPVAIVSMKAQPTQDKQAQTATAQTPPAATAPAASLGGRDAAPGIQTVTIIDGMSGKRQQVAIGSAPSVAAPSPQRQLTEESKHGPIPKIAADGARPSEIYASNRAIVGPNGAPRIAIVVGRLGISASTTSEALTKLPTAVTVAFVPYGRDLDRWAGRARDDGREVLLQVPMEPFDYPHNDPGPQGLLTTLSAEQNLDRLHWSMSRFQNYVGLANYMGARFTGNEPAMSVVMQEANKRGFLYFDDGSNGHSVAGRLADAGNVPFAQADVVIDGAAASGIDAALTRLEAVARERGLAVGYANALPIAIDRIAKWAKAAEARGLVLVPITAVANKPKSS
ncbi:MAG TPA: divergent polysaccharide deacetylase family protein, partial [Xanthobacteraceae bacterium]|nr:divergent polysaccharide deacetylase family protein [Xanthobacteraceae bacterium]